MTAAAYANQLLRSLDCVENVPESPQEAPAFSWARSGLMALTGRADGAPLMCPVLLTDCADGALLALKALAPEASFDFLGSQLLAERAAIFGHMRNGAISAGGSCRLLKTVDGHIALNLARDDDWSLMLAWLDAPASDWSSVEALVAKSTMHDLVEQGRLLGLAIAPLVPPPRKPVAWQQTTHQSQTRASIRKPLVVDLSSLWAGPLCSHLLQHCGAEVIKVESAQRPDGARKGPPEFFELLNAGKRSVVLDLSSEAGRAELRALLAQADIVIEASRPRALRQLGIQAETLLDEHPGLTWLSLTGYGRGEPQENWIAYGDDAGVAAGLSWIMRQAMGEMVFVGDAIADPFAGLHAALAAWASWRSGGGRLLSLSLVDVLRHCIQFDVCTSANEWRARQQAWTVQVDPTRVGPPRARIGH